MAEYISVEIDFELGQYAALLEIAVEEQCSLSEVVHRMVSDYMDKRVSDKDTRLNTTDSYSISQDEVKVQLREQRLAALNELTLFRKKMSKETITSTIVI